jgi:hypothetical protein
MNIQPQINPIINPVNNTIINPIIKSNRGRKSTKKILENKESGENIKTLYEFYNIKPVKIEINNTSNTNKKNENKNQISYETPI